MGNEEGLWDGGVTPLPSTLHSWPESHYSVTLGPDRLALDACQNKSSVEELLLSPGRPKSSEPSGLALARLAQPASLSSAVQPVPLATWPKAVLRGQPCWAQGFEPDFGKEGSRRLGRLRVHGDTGSDEANS